MINDFHQCLTESRAQQYLPLWEATYRSVFPTFIGMHAHPQDGPHQRAGIDRTVVLEGAQTFTVDEKVRGRNKITGKVYQDIALEIVSNDVTNAPGWAVKPLLCDYICYAIAPLGVAYMLPAIHLQTATKRDLVTWQDKYRTITAKNYGYNSVSICVPAKVVTAAISKSMTAFYAPTEV